MVDVVKSNELDRERFNRDYYEPKEPVIIKGEASNWKATQKWNPEYLDSLLGHQEAKLSFREDGISGASYDVEIESLPFSEARRRISEDGRCYVSQMSIERPWISRYTTGSSTSFPKLSEDIQKPRFLDDLAKIHHVSMFWFGGDSCKTAVHWDTLNNLFAQIFGKKRFRLFSPSQTEYLYPEFGTDYYHHARVNVFDPDENEFPLYEHAEPQELTLEPGDMLFIPKGWWHAADSLTTSISVNFWWAAPETYIRYLGEVLADRFDFSSPNLLKLPSELRL